MSLEQETLIGGNFTITQNIAAKQKHKIIIQ